MIKEFPENVQRLFNETVQDRAEKPHHTAEDLLAILRSKVTQPVQITTGDKYVRAVYYNVSVTLKNDLSGMDIAYNSDYKMTFHDLSSCDLHQLSAFVLALERDIPKWRHIWVADDKLRKEKAKIDERMKSAMVQFHSDWMKEWAHNDEQDIEQFRIRYYNLRACRMCLDDDNPFWEDKATEAEILDECRTLHIDPPMEEWYTDFTCFIDKCRQQRDVLDRQREEKRRNEEKERHLTRIKQLKLEAHIKSVEMHQGFSVSVEPYYPLQRLSFFTRHPMNEPVLVMRIDINGAHTTHHVRVKDVERLTPTIVNAISRINDTIPELNKALVEDGQEYHLTVVDCFAEHTLIGSLDKPFCVGRLSSTFGCLEYCTQLASHKVARRINEVISELQATLLRNRDETNVTEPSKDRGQ